jgi:hypothetical protein
VAFVTTCIAAAIGLAALSVVFVSSLGFLLISAVRIREWLINAISISLKVGSARQLGRRTRFRETFLCATPNAGNYATGLGVGRRTLRTGNASPQRMSVRK